MFFGKSKGNEGLFLTESEKMDLHECLQVQKADITAPNEHMRLLKVAYPNEKKLEQKANTMGSYDSCMSYELKPDGRVEFSMLSNDLERKNYRTEKTQKNILDTLKKRDNKKHMSQAL